MRQTVEVERSWVVAVLGSHDAGKPLPTLEAALVEAEKLLRNDPPPWAIQITPRERIVR